MATVNTSAFSAADRAAVQTNLVGALGRGWFPNASDWATVTGIAGAFGAGQSTSVDVTALSPARKAQVARLLRSVASEVNPPQFRPLVEQLATDVEA